MEAGFQVVSAQCRLRSVGVLVGGGKPPFEKERSSREGFKGWLKWTNAKAVSHPWPVDTGVTFLTSLTVVTAGWQ
jgi:hypothetical protein